MLAEERRRPEFRTVLTAFIAQLGKALSELQAVLADEPPSTELPPRITSYRSCGRNG
jgi:hypothetical protein